MASYYTDIGKIKLCVLAVIWGCMGSVSAAPLHDSLQPLPDYATDFEAETPALQSLEREVRFNDHNDNSFSGQQIDYLVKSWRESDKRANLYFSTGKGELENTSLLPFGDRDAISGSMTIDYARKNLYTSAKFEQFYAQDFLKHTLREYRVGFQAFDFGDSEIGSFFMLVAQQASDMKEGLKIKPALQLFGKEFQSEIDWDLGGEVMFNFKYTW